MKNQHNWTVEDDIVTYYLYKYGKDGLPYSFNSITSILGMKPGAMKMRLANFKAIDGKGGLSHFGIIAQKIYKKYKHIQQSRHRKEIIGILEAKTTKPSKLLREHYRILTELKKRGIIRTYNNPVADYGEWLVCKKFDLMLSKKSSKGFDATGKNCKRYQIKTRHLTPENKSMQLSFIRDLEKKQFNTLIAIIFNKDYNVQAAYAIPHAIIHRYTRYNKRINAHILVMKGAILKDKQVKNITRKLGH